MFALLLLLLFNITQTYQNQVSDQVECYLDASSKRPLIKVIEDVLLAPHVTHMLTNKHRGFDRLIEGRLNPPYMDDTSLPL
jgi:hypothetical protein